MSNPRRPRSTWRGEPMKAATFQRLMTLLQATYPGKVRRVVEVQPVAVLRTIDNEADTLETIRRLEAANVEVKRMSIEGCPPEDR